MCTSGLRLGVNGARLSVVQFRWVSQSWMGVVPRLVPTKHSRNIRNGSWPLQIAGTFVFYKWVLVPNYLVKGRLKLDKGLVHGVKSAKFKDQAK